MTSGALLPVIGVAGIGLARAAADAVKEGLSFAAELARGPDANAQIANADLERQRMQQQIEALAARIKQQLADAGIDVSQPLTLTSDGLGGIAAHDHPQKAAIEELLESDFLLLRDFERLKDEYEASEGHSDDFRLIVTQSAL